MSKTNNGMAINTIIIVPTSLMIWSFQFHIASIYCIFGTSRLVLSSKYNPNGNTSVACVPSPNKILLALLLPTFGAFMSINYKKE